MTHEPRTEERSGFLARLNPIETLVLALIALVALAGLMLIGKGMLLKAQTDVAQLQFDNRPYQTR